MAMYPRGCVVCAVAYAANYSAVVCSHPGCLHGEVHCVLALGTSCAKESSAVQHSNSGLWKDVVCVLTISADTQA